MASCTAACLGANACCVFCSSGSVLAPVSRLNTLPTRLNSWPLFSRATSVLSKVGAWRLSAIFCTSSNCCFMPASRAGMKSAFFILSNAGAWYGRLLADRNGLSDASLFVCAPRTITSFLRFSDLLGPGRPCAPLGAAPPWALTETTGAKAPGATSAATSNRLNNM